VVATINSQSDTDTDAFDGSLLGDTNPSSFWHLNAINIEAARAKNLTGNKCILGVLDTGIDASHPEFAGKTIWFAKFDAAGSITSNLPTDMGSHGTHVCGIASGKNCGFAPAADLAVAGVFNQYPDGSIGSRACLQSLNP